MAQLKRTIARLVFYGISIVGLLVGLTWLWCGITFIFSLERDGLVFQLIFSGMMLVLGAWLTYASYVMFRKRALEPIKSFLVLLAMSVFGSVVEPLSSFATPWVNGIEARTLVDLACCLVALVLSVLFYSICTKLLKRLVEVAYGPQEISGAPSPTDQGGAQPPPCNPQSEARLS